MEEDLNGSFEIGEILTFIDNSHSFEAIDTFKYYSLSSGLCDEIPRNEQLFLVEWKNFSILQCTWTPREEIEGNSQIDPGNLFRKFVDKNTIDGVLYQPRLTKLLPAKELVPEKVLSSCFDNSATEMFLVKWRYRGNTFLSTEEPSFFEDPRYKMLITQFRNIVNKQQFFSSLKEIPLFKRIDSQKDFKDEGICNEVFKKMHEGHGCWLKNNNDPNGLCQSHKLKLCILKYLGLLFGVDVKGPHLIVTDEEGIDFYRENIEKIIPTAYVTYITELPTDAEMKEELDNELYHPEIKCLKCSIVVTTTTSFQFHESVKFDIVIIDSEPSKFFGSKYCINEKSFLLLYNGKYDESQIKSHCKRNKMKELKKFEHNYDVFFIRYVDVYLQLQDEQEKIYKNMIDLVKESNEDHTDVLINLIKESLTYPKQLVPNLKTQGVKVNFVFRCLKLLGSIEKIKIAILGDYDIPLLHIAKVVNANYIGWKIDIEKSAAICEIMKCGSESESEKLKVRLEKKLNESIGKTRNGLVSLSSNPRVVCVHNGCISTGIDLSCIDVVIDMSNDYTPLFEANIRNKYLIATSQPIIAIDMSVKNTIEEITSSMNELDETLDQTQELEVYSDSIKNNIYKYGYRGTKKNEKFARLPQILLRYMAEENSLQMVLEVKKDEIGVIDNFKKLGTVSFNKKEKVEPKKQNKTLKLKKLPKTLKLPLESDPNTRKQPIPKLTPPTVYNKERIMQKFPHEANLDKKDKPQITRSSTKSPYEIKQKSLHEPPQIPINELVEIFEVDSVTSEDSQPYVDQNIVNIIKDQVPLIQEEKAKSWVKSLTSTIKRFGSSVDNWKCGIEQYVPLNKIQLQGVVNKLILTPGFDSEATKMAFMMKSFETAHQYVLKKKSLLPFPSCKLKYWDSSCDVTLLKLIIDNGLNVPELYLNDLVIMGVLGLAGLETEKQKCDFLLERIETMYNCYSKYKFD